MINKFDQKNQTHIIQFIVNQISNYAFKEIPT